jgi:hypothetical protein
VEALTTFHVLLSSFAATANEFQSHKKVEINNKKKSPKQKRCTMTNLISILFLLSLITFQLTFANLGYNVRIDSTSVADYASLHTRSVKFLNDSCAPITFPDSCDDVGFVKLAYARVSRAVDDSPAVFVAVVIDTSRRALLTHFLAHYTRLGVRKENFIIVLHVGESMSDDGAYIKALLIKDGFPFVEWWGVFTTGAKAFHLLHALQITHATDYIVWADLDEMHNFSPLLSSLGYDIVSKYFKSNSCTAMRGKLIDRVAASGLLEVVREDVDLAIQFPLRCNLTSRVVKGTGFKTLLTAANIRTDGGHHLVPALSYFEVRGLSYLLPKPLVYRSRVCMRLAETSHYKWTEGAVEYLANRMKNFKEKNIPWWVESQRVLKQASSEKSFVNFCR